jgi:oligopeptidase B
MRDREDPGVIDYLRAENDYLELVMQHTKPLQARLFLEMKGRIPEQDSSVPEKKGDYFYYSRMERNRQYPVYCRKKHSLDAPEEILIDQNLLAEGRAFCSLGALAVSPDGTKLAYSVDLQGAEVYTLYVKDLASGELYPDRIDNISGYVYHHTGVEWGNDSQTLFYVTLDHSHRACNLHRHRLGTDPASDPLIYHESDGTYSLWFYKSRSERYIMTYHYNTVSQEVRFLSADEPAAALQVIRPRQPGVEYSAAHHGNSFYILINDNAPNFKIMKAPVRNLESANWKELVSHRPDVLIESMDVFEDYLVLHERRDGLKQIRVSGIDGASNVRYVQFPESSYDVTMEHNPEYRTNILRFKYSSMISPHSIVDYHMDTSQWETKKVYAIPSGYEKSDYVTERLHARSPDGTQVPITLVYRKGIERGNGKNPTLLYGYGAYGASSDVSFNPNLVSLLDRGFIFAIGHIRGGSEMGRAWYEDGRWLKKKNSFTDFISCAEHLVREGFTSNQKLAITGSSAGGLLVGACMVMRPDLFKAAVCKVPFLDVITSMSDPSIPLVTLEYDQWGNPADEATFEYMLSYSPYDNLQPVEYPHLLLTTGFNDPRVAYWEAAKFAARLRSIKKGDSLVLLRTDFSSGHGGATGRYDDLRDSALEYAFLIDMLE